MHLHVIDFLGKMERFLLALFEATVETSHLLILDTSKKKKNPVTESSPNVLQKLR